jgi:hypothetical protein
VPAIICLPYLPAPPRHFFAGTGLSVCLLNDPTAHKRHASPAHATTTTTLDTPLQTPPPPPASSPLKHNKTWATHVQCTVLLNDHPHTAIQSTTNDTEAYARLLQVLKGQPARPPIHPKRLHSAIPENFLPLFSHFIFQQIICPITLVFLSFPSLSSCLYAMAGKASYPFIAAGVAALGEIVVMQPLDVLKTRLQLQAGDLH